MYSGWPQIFFFWFGRYFVVRIDHWSGKALSGILINLVVCAWITTVYNTSKKEIFTSTSISFTQFQWRDESVRMMLAYLGKYLSENNCNLEDLFNYHAYGYIIWMGFGDAFIGFQLTPNCVSHNSKPLPWASEHWMVQYTLECHWNATGWPSIHWHTTGPPSEYLQGTLECHWKNLVESTPHWDATGETLTFAVYTGTPLVRLW